MRRIFTLSLALLAACPAPQAEPDSDTGATSGADTSPTGETGATGDECVGPNGCYACEVNEPSQLLNACSDAACQPFPNTNERLPLLKADGTRPPLP